MSAGKTTLSIVKGHRTVFVAINVVLLLLELGIFQSGEHYKLQFWDQNGDLIYETDGKNLNDLVLLQFSCCNLAFEANERIARTGGAQRMGH
jgi:hypothetical protein